MEAEGKVMGTGHSRKLHLTGELHAFRIGSNKPRRYFVVTKTYEEIQGFVQAFLFKATGAGASYEQRSLRPPHVQKLKREMLAGTFTPTVFNAAMTDVHREHFKEKDEQFTLDVTDAAPLHWVDGNHRLNALAELYKDDAHKTLIGKAPITFFVYVDGDPREDFINLQSGLAIDKAHLMSLRVKTKAFSDEDNPKMKMGFDIAKALNAKNSGSHLEGKMRLDSNVTKGSKLIRFDIFLAGGSQRPTSIIGGVEVAKQFGKDAEWLKDIYVKVYKTLDEDAPQVLEEGKILCPPPAGGNGSAALLIGIANVFAYRVCVRSGGKPTEADFERLVDAVKGNLNIRVPDGGVSAGVKRSLMGDFTKLFCSDLVVGPGITLPHINGIPRPLGALWGWSGLGVSRDEVRLAGEAEAEAAAAEASEEAAEKTEAAKDGKATPKRRGRTTKGRMLVSSGK